MKRSRKIIDISMPLKNPMPVWPDSRGIRIFQTGKIQDGDNANVTQLEMDVHVGTHVESPLHFLADGFTIDQADMSVFIGPAYVAYLPKVKLIGPEELGSINIPPGTERLLFRTDNSDSPRAGKSDFDKNYVALTFEAAELLSKSSVKLIGIDYLSIQRYQDPFLTHTVLMEKGILILEGLNLANVAPGIYELFCLPLRLTGVEASPARAILIS